MRSAFAAALAFLGMCAASDRACAAVLDQNNWPATGSFSLEAQQEVRVGISGQLKRIDLAIDEDRTGLAFTLNFGRAWQTDANDVALHNLASVGGILSVDLTAANIYVSSGDFFVFSIFAPPPPPIELDDGTVCFCGEIFIPLMIGTTDDEYDEGDLYFGGSFFGGTDIAFRTYVEPTALTAVPAPPALLLLGTALAALAACRRRTSGVN